MLTALLVDELLDPESDSVGDALLWAKWRYQADLSVPTTSFDRKTINGTVLYGLPQARLTLAGTQHAEGRRGSLTRQITTAIPDHIDASDGDQP